MDNEFKNWDDDFILYCYDDEDKITEKLKNCINELCEIIKNYNLDN